MAIIKRGRTHSIAVRIDGKQVWISSRTEGKTRASKIEHQLTVACASRDYRFLDAEARAICIRLFENRAWTIPKDLRPPEILTLGKAVEMFRESCQFDGFPPYYSACLDRAVAHFGAGFPVEDFWIPQIREFIATLSGLAPSTIRHYKDALSALFTFLQEARLVTDNPAMLVKSPSENGREREVHISHSDFQRVLVVLPTWLRPVAQTAYYTGMRLGEILGLTRDQVSLSRRIISLGAEDTKERHKKRVPIHQDLVPILADALKVRALKSTHLFLRDGHAISASQAEDHCRRAVARLPGLEGIRFHALRHTWKANARRSGVADSVSEAILGHADRKRPVNQRYGYVSDEELLQAIDRMAFDHGETRLIPESRGKMSAITSLTLCF